jgi:hypothetical protein
VTARVEAADEGYRVELRSIGNRLGWSCTCPDGRGGALCGNVVAADREA